MKVEKWVAIDKSSDMGSINAKPVEWDKDGNPVKYVIWDTARPEPPHDNCVWDIKTLRDYWRRESECQDE